jgi:hypothetical protein
MDNDTPNPYYEAVNFKELKRLEIEAADADYKKALEEADFEHGMHLHYIEDKFAPYEECARQFQSEVK